MVPLNSARLPPRQELDIHRCRVPPLLPLHALLARGKPISVVDVPALAARWRSRRCSARLVGASLASAWLVGAGGPPTRPQSVVRGVDDSGTSLCGSDAVCRPIHGSAGERDRSRGHAPMVAI